MHGEADTGWKVWQGSLAQFKKFYYKCIKNHLGDQSTTQKLKK